MTDKTALFSSNYQFNYLIPYSFHKEILLNENFSKLDCLLSYGHNIISHLLDSPPEKEKLNEGDAFLLPNSKCGEEWQNQNNKIAIFYGKKWLFFQPRIGYIAWFININKLLVLLPHGWCEIETKSIV